jgi:hypothetical protein
MTNALRKSRGLREGVWAGGRAASKGGRHLNNWIVVETSESKKYDE